MKKKKRLQYCLDFQCRSNNRLLLDFRLVTLKEIYCNRDKDWNFRSCSVIESPFFWCSNGKFGAEKKVINLLRPPNIRICERFITLFWLYFN